MTGPVNAAASSAANSAAAAVTTVAKKTRNPMLGLASLATLAAAGLLVKDSYNGSQLKRADAVAAAKEHAEWGDMEYGWGHWSGHPWMDHQAHRFKRLMLFGPFNLGIRWQEFKINANSLINDVLLKNLIPIGVGIGSLYAAFGAKSVHKALFGPFRYVAKHFSIPSSFKRQMGRIISQATGSMGKGLVKLLKMPFKSPLSLVATVGAGLLGGFFLNRFRDSYGHDGQHEFFRDLTNVKGH